MMTVQQWREFLQQWSDEWLARDHSLPALVRRSRWLGTRPASEKQIAQLEKRIGYRLPASYRNFLLVTNGWSYTSEFIERLRPANKVEWLLADDPQLLDVWAVDDDVELRDGVPPEEYFTYDGRPFFDRQHLRESLIIADPVAGDSMIYLLNPRVVAQDGEWEAWRFAHWIPGAERFPSFELLMRTERASFLAAGANSSDQFLGPYEGVYAPDQPRRSAIAIGRGRPIAPRLTIPQLITQLESSERNLRLAAAKQLFREYRPHDPQDEHPELVEHLGRILRSKLETDVRSAAAMMLGSYGDVNAIPLLIDALADVEFTSVAISALFHLSISTRDSRIADAMVSLMETPRDYFVVDHAINILEELKDPRVAAIGLWLLDHAEDIPLKIPPTADMSVALAYQRASLRMRGAFAYSQFADEATQELVARLNHPDPGVRAAAVAALRKDPKRGRHLETPLKPLLDDPDPGVKQQAEMTLRFLAPQSPVEISPERLTEIHKMAEAQFRKAKSRQKNRF